MKARSLRETIFPWQRRFQADYVAAGAYLAAMDQWQDEQVVAGQLKSVQAIWADCTADIPYYRNLVKSGAAPERISSWKDFHAIPELNREILQNKAAEFVRLSGPPELTKMTGGSTGAPVRFGMWQQEDQVLRRLKLALWIRAGYTPDSRLFLIWGHAHLLGTGWRRRWNHAVRKFKDRLVGYQRMDAYSMSPAYCRSIAQKLIAFRPTGLVGYASALDYFIRCTEEFHPQFQRLGCKFVMPCAEPPPRPDTLLLLRANFGAQIIQEFGGVDFGQVGMKMNEEPFETFSDHNLLEAIPQPGQENRSGAALVTTLYRRYFPLIRYRQGDEIRGCQRLDNGHVSRFAELGGRLNDMVSLSGGQSIHSVAFLHCLHQEPGIINAQLVLADAGLSLRVVPRDTLTAECQQRIRHRLGQLAPELKNIPLEEVTDLETSVAGKRRWFLDKRNSRKN